MISDFIYKTLNSTESSLNIKLMHSIEYNVII